MGIRIYAKNKKGQEKGRKLGEKKEDHEAEPAR